MEYQSQDPKLDAIVKTLVDHFHPTQVFLFGSRANGNARPESDYDLFLVIKNSEKSPVNRMQEANLLLWKNKSKVDVFIYTEEEYNSWKNELNTIANTVLSEGKELQIGQ